MLRPWQRSAHESLQKNEGLSLGDANWRRALPMPKLHANAPTIGALTAVQRRKLLNVFVSVADQPDAPYISEAAVVSRLGRGVPRIEALARRFWSAVADAAAAARVAPREDTLDRAAWLLAWAHILHAHTDVPPWLLELHAAQWEVASVSSGGFMDKERFLAWRSAASPLSSKQLCAATKCDGWGSAADAGPPTGWGAAFDAAAPKGGLLNSEGWVKVVRRFYTSVAAYDELNDVALL